MFSLLESRDQKYCHNIAACLPKPFHARIIQVSNNITTTQHRTQQHSWKIHFSYADNFCMSLFSCPIKLMNHVNHNVNNSAASLIFAKQQIIYFLDERKECLLKLGDSKAIWRDLLSPKYSVKVSSPFETQPTNKPCPRAGLTQS